MNVDKLNLMWIDLSKAVITKGFKSLNISTECFANIFVGVNSIANRCLILELPKVHNVNTKSVIKENLSLDYYPLTNFIVLQLTDNNYYDLFDDLILSMYHRIKTIKEVNDYSREFVQTFFKWSEFFVDRKTSVLSTEIVKGILGELLVLKDLIIECNHNEINDMLNYWKGPFDHVHDFVLPSKNIEVKTKDITSIDIRISSEYQLEAEFEKGLELCVINIEKDLINGISLQDLILEIKKLIIDKLGDTSLLFKALSQKGISAKNMQIYDTERFIPLNQIIYNCMLSAFPKITISNIPEQINGIKYNIRISNLNEFIISEKKFNYGD